MTELLFMSAIRWDQINAIKRQIKVGHAARSVSK
jgi:hypothetical protein